MKNAIAASRARRAVFHLSSSFGIIQRFFAPVAQPLNLLAPKLVGNQILGVITHL